MASKEAVEPARGTSLRQSHEGFLQGNGRPWIIAGAHHVLDSVIIRLAFGVAAITLGDELGAKLAGADNVISILVVAAGYGTHCEDTLQNSATGDRLGAMTGGRVHDLVSEHGGQFSFIVEFV